MDLLYYVVGRQSRSFLTCLFQYLAKTMALLVHKFLGEIFFVKEWLDAKPSFFQHRIQIRDSLRTGSWSVSDQSMQPCRKWFGPTPTFCYIKLIYTEQNWWFGQGSEYPLCLGYRAKRMIFFPEVDYKKTDTNPNMNRRNRAWIHDWLFKRIFQKKYHYMLIIWTLGRQQ